MNHTRRDFLRLTATAGSMISLGSTIPGFLNRTAAAAQPSDRPGAKDTILVVVELTGGNDGLNTVVPYADPEYAKLRTRSASPRPSSRRSMIRSHFIPPWPALRSCSRTMPCAVVQGVGYPNPSQSHFRSMDIWQAGSTAATLTEGWIGKALKSLPGCHVISHRGQQSDRSACRRRGSDPGADARFAGGFPAANGSRQSRRSRRATNAHRSRCSQRFG